MKLREAKLEGQHYAWRAWCPACKEPHTFRGWTFNGNMEKPTFSPSMLVTWNYGDPPAHNVCHSFLTDGAWHFLNDCTHELAGKIVPLPDYPEGGSW